PRDPGPEPVDDALDHLPVIPERPPPLAIRGRQQTLPRAHWASLNNAVRDIHPESPATTPSFGRHALGATLSGPHGGPADDWPAITESLHRVDPGTRTSAPNRVIGNNGGLAHPLWPRRGRERPRPRQAN